MTNRAQTINRGVRVAAVWLSLLGILLGARPALSKTWSYTVHYQGGMGELLLSGAASVVDWNQICANEETLADATSTDGPIDCAPIPSKATSIAMEGTDTPTRTPTAFAVSFLGTNGKRLPMRDAFGATAIAACYRLRINIPKGATKIVVSALTSGKIACSDAASVPAKGLIRITYTAPDPVPTKRK